MATYFNGCSGTPKIGDIRIDAVLMLKMLGIHHAIHSSKDGAIIFWCDTDVTFRKPLPVSVQNWLRKRDITYILVMINSDYGPFEGFNISTSDEEEQRAFLAGHWKVESGLVAFTVNDRTRAFIDKAIQLYRGGMYEWVRDVCLKRDKRCKGVNYMCSNPYLNDVYVYSILLHSDAHKNPFFHVGLKHGWFAMKGLEPWGEEKLQWGFNNYAPNCEPSTKDSTIRANFHIGEYVFHHFGYHKKGGLAVQLFHGAKHADQSKYYRHSVLRDYFNESLQHFLSCG